MRSEWRGTGVEPFVVRSRVTLVIPQGCALSIAGSFTVAVRRHCFAFDPDAWAFLAGAVAAFVGLAMLARRGLSSSIVAQPTGLRTLFNVVPFVTILGVAAVNRPHSVTLGRIPAGRPLWRRALCFCSSPASSGVL